MQRLFRFNYDFKPENKLIFSVPNRSNGRCVGRGTIYDQYNIRMVLSRKERECIKQYIAYVILLGYCLDLQTNALNYLRNPGLVSNTI